MPNNSYEDENGHQFIELRAMSAREEPIACPECGAPGKYIISLGTLGLRAIDTKVFRVQIRSRTRDIVTGHWEKLEGKGLRGEKIEAPTSRPESENKTTISPLDPYKRQR